MHRNEQFSADVIKIFHNAKGSIKTKILEWTNNENEIQENKTEHQNVNWKSHHESPHNYAAGEYEPLLHNQTTSNYEADLSESSNNRHNRLEFKSQENLKNSHTNKEPTSFESKKRMVNSEILHQSQDELYEDDLFL